MKNNKNVQTSAKSKSKASSKSSKTKKSNESKKSEKSKASSKVTLASVTIGKPTLELTYTKLLLIVAWASIAIFVNLLMALELFSESVRIRNRLGRFIDMISSGSGAILPLFQTMPVFFSLILNVSYAYLIFKIFSKKPRPKVNLAMFILIMINLVWLFIMFILLFVLIGHIYGSHEHLHDGITNAMSEYSSNAKYKSLMDRLQIELQCCGSKKYDEWYSVKWLDSSLNKKENASESSATPSEGHAPFSCCKKSILGPCIHHNIESTGKSYLYTPELNLSISTTGCFSKIQEKRKLVGWKVVGNLILFILLQVTLLMPIRFLQTAHYHCGFFEGSKRVYYGWLIGSYKKVQKSNKDPPTPPPVPPELRK